MFVFNKKIKLLSLITVILFYSSCESNKKVMNSEIKYNPGHYVSVGPFFELSEVKHLSDSNVQGVNKRYFWRTLEPEKDIYDFSFIEQDLDYCSKHNKQLIVFLIDRLIGKKVQYPIT